MMAINKKYEGAIVLMACLAALVSTAFYYYIFNPPITTDAKQFDDLGWNLSRGIGYVDHDFKPSMFREPAYPFLLACIYKVFGHDYGVVAFVQAFLFAGTVLLTYLLARIVFRVRDALISAFVVSLFPTLGNYAIYILSETFFMFLLVAFVLILTVGLKRRSYLLVFVSGLLLGLLALTKAIMLFFVPVLAVALFLYGLGRDGFQKRALINSVLLALALAMVVWPWISRNHRLFNTYSISLRGGKALYNRALKLDYGPKRWAAMAVYSVSEYIGGKLYPDPAMASNKFLLAEDAMAHQRAAELMVLGHDEAGADRIMTKEALAKIKRRPFAYLAQSFVEGIKLLGFTHMPSLNEDDVAASFAGFRNGRAILAFLRGILRIAAYPIFILSLCGMWVARHRWRDWFVMGLTVFYVTGIYALTFSWARYTVPLIPFYVIFATVFFKSFSEERDRVGT